MQAGDVVPDFTLHAQDGAARSLSTVLRDGPLALFFYPAAMTAGCTRESCHFRDLAAEFAALGAQRIGISMDSVERQSEFTSRNHLDYPLLADVDGDVARLFGVKRAIGFLKVKRTTFVIDRDAKVVEVITSETNMNAHADLALAALRSLAP